VASPPFKPPSSPTHPLPLSSSLPSSSSSSICHLFVSDQFINPFPTPSLSKTSNFNTIKMSANKSSAVSDEPIDVLVALQDKFDLLDMAGPVEAFSTALHDFKDPCKP
jgi:hypothetical protein